MAAMAVDDGIEKRPHSRPSLFAHRHHHHHHQHDPEADTKSYSSGKDIALGLVGEHAQVIDPEVEARVVRKIDRFLIPAMVAGM